MKTRLIPLLLALCLMLSIPVSALKAEDFKQGKLSGIAVAEDGALLVSDTYNKVVWRVEGETVTQTPARSASPDSPASRPPSIMTRWRIRRISRSRGTCSAS